MQKQFVKCRLACAAMVTLSCVLPCVAQSDWVTYGHDAGQTKYSPLDQINTANVDQLKQAWIYHGAAACGGSSGTPS